MKIKDSAKLFYFIYFILLLYLLMFILFIVYLKKKYRKLFKVYSSLLSRTSCHLFDKLLRPQTKYNSAGTDKGERSVKLLRGNARSYTASTTKDIIMSLVSDVSQQSAYSLDITTSDHLFRSMQHTLPYTYLQLVNVI